MLDLAHFIMRHLFPVSFFVLIQSHSCCRNMCIISSLVIGSLGGLIITAQASPYLFCPPGRCTYNSHIIKDESFLAYFMCILNSCVV